MFNLGGILKGRWTLWIFALFFALLAGLGSLFILGSAADRVSYYVVNTDIAAGVQITPEILDERTSPADGVPPNPLTLADVQSNDLFSVVPLQAGTVLQASMVSTDMSYKTATLPAGYVLSTVLVAPEDAVGGRISRGDYIDIASVTGGTTDSVAKIVMQHVLVVDVAVSPQSIASAANQGTDPAQEQEPTTGALYSGIPSLYTLAVSPTDFAKLALIRKGSIYLALSAAKTPSELDVSVSANQLYAGGPVGPSSMGAGSSTGTVAPGAATKNSVEMFIDEYQAKVGHTLVVNGDVLEARNASGAVVDTIALAGGTVDLTTGLWTAG